MQIQAPGEVVIPAALTTISLFLGYIIWKIRNLDEMKTEQAVQGLRLQDVVDKVTNLHLWRNKLQEEELRGMKQQIRDLKAGED